MKRFKTALCLSLLCGCTMQQNSQGELQGQLHPPLVYSDWHVDKGTDQGMQFCSVSAGYRGFDVVLWQDKKVFVESGWRINPDTIWTLRTDNNTFKTRSTFSEDTSKSIIESLLTSNKAYLEWSEIQGGRNSNRIGATNIVQLGGFKERYESCRRNLGY